MQRKPRATDASIFDRRTLIRGALQGLILLTTVLAVYTIALRQNIDAEQARALAFTAMVVGNIGLIFINRSLSRQLRSALRLPNPTLWWVVGMAIAVLMAALSVPALSVLFYFGQPSAAHLAISVLAALTCIVLIALIKMAGYLDAEPA